MSTMKFDRYRVSSRKDLLHFVADTLSGANLYTDIGKHPKEWIEELCIINGMLTGENLVAGIGIRMPPENDPDFQRLGENVFLYRGQKENSRGLWLSEQTKIHNSEMKLVPYTQWTHYRMGSWGTLSVNADFSDIPYETFLPENFEPKSKVVKNDKRPILFFEIPRNGGKALGVYAKGCNISTSRLYNPPSYRRTNLIGIEKVSSRNEMDRIIKLHEHGIHVPVVFGYYETPTEEFLFLKNVEGTDPSKFLDSKKERRIIIEQDAGMLAALCALGYRKIGFQSYDDKIFDGKNLYLIDTEEFDDLYFPENIDFRDLVLNPVERSKLDDFRSMQRDLFIQTLRDAIYEYRKTLLRNSDDMSLYVKKFYEKIGWKEPSRSEINKIITYPKNYITMSHHIGMMMEE